MTGRVVRGRNRVLLSDSSDEEDNNIDVVVKHVVAEGNVAAPSVIAPSVVDTMLLDDEISDDDISDEPPPVNIFPLAEPVRVFAQENNMDNFDRGGNPLHQLLRRRGINVHSEWLDSFVGEMKGSHPGFSTFGVEKQGELALAHLLVTDFNEVGAGCLPNSFETLHAIELSGPFVLQVDEISDIGAPLRDRYHERGAGISRCLKLSMTDGVQRVVGIEYQPIAALRNLIPAGSKICVRNVFVRRGVFLLSSESIEVIGGLVQRLEEARVRAVHEVNKPARGSRHRRGQTGDRSLIERVAAEAWPIITDESHPAVAPHTPQDTPDGRSVQPILPTAASIFQSFVAQGQPGRSVQASLAADTDANVGHSSRVSRAETRSNALLHQATPVVAPARSETRSNVAVQQADPPVDSIRTETRLHVAVQQATPAVGSTVQSLEVRRKQTTIPWAQTSANHPGFQENSSKIPGNTPGSHGTQQRAVEQNATHDRSALASGVQTHMNLDSDDDEFYSPSVPSTRHNTPAFGEEPFTYLALLREKLPTEPEYTGAVGKIKCVLTGVKDFQYKDCDEFTLVVHIDDGSLVTEALIHHDVVQKMVGFSPKEVNSALAKSNTQESREMKSTMKRFQAFLKKFEGMIHVQHKQLLGMPVISHMEEGVTDGDLTALQNRAGKDASTQHGPIPIPDFIDVSP